MEGREGNSEAAIAGDAANNAVSTVGGADGASARGTDAPMADGGTASVSAPSPAPSSTSSTGQRPYIPQFSAATQMILSRINSNPGSLSAALSSASSMARGIEKSAFDDAKRRLVMNMNTSLTMPMPMPLPPTKKRQLSSVSSAFQLRTAAPLPAISAARPILPMPVAPKAAPIKTKAKLSRGTKRKRGKDDDDASSSLSEISDSDMDAVAKAKTAATMTKSGRQVQKPTQFNPVDVPGSQKRKHYGKRTAEQALCKVCTRGFSPSMNQIVFCDGCNFCWHQMCHDPYIDDDFVSDESKSWFCGRCLAKREKALAKKKTMQDHKGVSWASKTAAQKRTYLTNLPHAQLVNLIMYGTELHPDLPIFPGQDSGPPTKRSSQGSATAPRATESIKLSGPVAFSSAVSTPDAKGSDTGGKSKAKRKGSASVENQAQAAERESSPDSVPPAWPKVGQGVLAGINIDEDDLRDKNDFEAFSVTTYDAKGQKVTENGMNL